MFAAVVRANLPGGINPERKEQLDNQVIPMVSGAPGFVTGYWLDVVDNQGLAFIIFDNEASAKAAAPPAGADMGSGVTIESVEFRAVLGNA